MDDALSSGGRKGTMGIPVAIVLAGLIVAAALFFRTDPVGPDRRGEALASPVPGQVAGEQVVDVSIDDDDPVLGEAGAPVTMVEFTDFECPYCKQYHDTTFAEIKNRYVNTGKVRYVVKHFPLLQIHPRAQAAGIAAQCAAAQGKFFEYVDQLFGHQQALSDTDLLSYARAVGLDGNRFSVCYADPATKAAVEADQRAGIAAGVTGTPGFFVNGQPLDGARPLNQFEALIEAELAK